MKKFFTRFKTKEPDPTNASWGNVASFYSLLLFLIAIPFVLIVALVWLSGIMGFNAYIFAGFAALLLVAVWRIYKGWDRFKQRLAAQSSEVQDLMRTAAQTGSNMEVSVMNGLFPCAITAAGACSPRPCRPEGWPPWPSRGRSWRRRPWRLPRRSPRTHPGGAHRVPAPAGRGHHHRRGVRPPQNQPAAAHP